MNGKILVRDVHQPSQSVALIVLEEEHLPRILEKFVQQPFIRGIFVVDKENRYLGMIKRDDLLQWAKVKLGDLSGLEDYITKYSATTTAKELIHKHSGDALVEEDDDIIKALRLMLSRDLTDLPVIDKKGNILGDLTIPELLSKVIEVCWEGKKML